MDAFKNATILPALHINFASTYLYYIHIFPQGSRLYHPAYIYGILCTSLTVANPCGRAVYGMGLWPLTCWDCGFESCQWHGCLFLVSTVCCAGTGTLRWVNPSSKESYQMHVCHRMPQ